MLARLREVLHREPLLVVPTSRRRRPLRARARGRRGGVRRPGADLRAAGAGDRPGSRGWRAAARSGGAQRVGGPRSPMPGCACWRRRPRRRASRGGRALFAELQRSLVEPRASRARCARGAACPTRTSWPCCTRPTAGGSRAGRPDRRARRGRRSTRCANPAVWGRRPVFLYGFDELTRAQLDAVETCRGSARPTSGSRSHRAGPPRAGGERGDGPSCRRWPRWSAGERAEHYAGARAAALHHLERGLFEAGAERRRRTARCGCSRLTASARRPRSSAPRCSS